MIQNKIRTPIANQKCFVNIFSLLFIVAIVAQTAAAIITNGKLKNIAGPDTQLPIMK
jgi:hypothetical protein